MIIKVCGIKYNDNLKEIVTVDIDMIGINFYKHSSRFAEHIDVTIFPSHISKIGVFVNAGMTEILNYKDQYGLDMAQLHGEESPGFCDELAAHIPIVKAIPVSELQDLNRANLYSSVKYLLFDTKTSQHGGSGLKFNWDYLDQYKGDVPFLLAGGIGFMDAGELLSIQHPQFAGADINSRFEIEPGRKDVNLIRDFVSRIKNKNL